ncbi:MAG: hypothetical protein HY002_21605 [Candidatus Rokubacteria bacterium]|nr:hypothetical protein [Candidatus Rokubacteria bacterium]
MPHLPAAVLAGLLVLASGAAAEERPVSLYDQQGHRTGYGTLNRETGRRDLFRPDGTRLGWGRVDARTGAVDLFTPDGRRPETPVIVVPALTGRR